MARARKSDTADLEALLEQLAKPPGLRLEKSDVATLRRHRDIALAYCLPLIEGPDVDVALGASVAVIALGHIPNLATIRQGFLSDDGRRVLKAAALTHVVTQGQSAELLAMCESVAAVAGTGASGYAVDAAIALRGHAAPSDLAALHRLYDAGHFHITSTLTHVVDAAHGRLRTDAMALFERVVDRQPPVPGALVQFAARADASHIARLWRAVDETSASDQGGDRFHVLGALTRLRAAGIRECLLHELDAPHGLSIALDYLMELLRGTRDVEAVARLEARAAGLSRGYAESHIARAIGAIGGPDTLPLLERRFGTIASGDLADARIEALGLTLPTALDRLVELGLIDATQRRALPVKVTRPGGMESQILDVLVRAGFAYRFDAEFSGTPVPHDGLLASLAELAPDLDIHDIAQEGPEPGVEEYAYVVRFKSAGRLYESRCGDQSDWYDHEPVAGLINQALSAAGKQVQLIRVGADGQYPVYLCAPPSAVDRVAKLGLISIG